MMSLTRAARVVAWLAGRTHLLPSDLHAVAPSVLAHRIFFTPVYELRRAEIAEELVRQILEKVPTPRTQ
jgi:MoxR-like ATPase